MTSPTKCQRSTLAVCDASLPVGVAHAHYTGGLPSKGWPSFRVPLRLCSMAARRRIATATVGMALHGGSNLMPSVPNLPFGRKTRSLCIYVTALNHFRLESLDAEEP